ncbi:MAG: tRNA 2-thiouridine(34) synthase MnmA [Candidatus Saccharimonadales bacterium]
MKKIFVGMSGGVDSSTTAALLKEQGKDVTGVYMKNWTKDIAGNKCPWREDLADAQSVAARLDIPLEIFDFQDQYRQKVVDYMIAEYEAGRTPNPDIMCNQEIKFKLFLDTALEAGAEMIATGHYARIVDISEEGEEVKGLYAGVDESKDQSYFLYRMPPEALYKTLFPLGDMNKSQVRKMAKKLKLPNASKADSQGICFVGEVDIKDFLREHIDVKPGPIKNMEGKILGEHEGAQLYTIGQRQGLGVGGGLPLYVVSKNIATNTIYVTDNLNTLMSGEIKLDNLHWLNQAPEVGDQYMVRTRHLGKLTEAEVVDITENTLTLKLSEPERAVTAGQSAVLYKEDNNGKRVVGGGIITI